MSIAFLAAPIEVFVESRVYNGPGLWIGTENGVTYNSDYERDTWFENYLVVTDDGLIRHFQDHELRVEWRYDWTAHEWVDVNGVTDGGEEDLAPDGGEEVPGRVPDPDEFGAGDPLDEEGGATPGDPGRMDTGEA